MSADSVVSGLPPKDQPTLSYIDCNRYCLRPLSPITGYRPPRCCPLVIRCVAVKDGRVPVGHQAPVGCPLGDITATANDNASKMCIRSSSFVHRVRSGGMRD